MTKKKLLPQKIHFKTALSKKTSQYCSLKKCVSKTHAKLLPQKMYFKNTFQIATTKTFFISASINFVKNKIVL